jgi:hypothetical protein
MFQTFLAGRSDQAKRHALQRQAVISDDITIEGLAFDRYQRLYRRSLRHCGKTGSHGECSFQTGVRWQSRQGS